MNRSIYDADMLLPVSLLFFASSLQAAQQLVGQKLTHLDVRLVQIVTRPVTPSRSGRQGLQESKSRQHQGVEW